jgi:hypothetical protein
MHTIKNLVMGFLISLLLVGPSVGLPLMQDPPLARPSSAGNTTNHTLFLPRVTRGQPAGSIFGVEMFEELANTYDSSPADLMAKAGATWVRRNAVLWSEVEPSPGIRRWNSSLDAELISAQKFHLRPVLVIRSTPSWAQKYANKLCGPIKADALDEFAVFMRDVVARYSGYPYYVRYYELWNEPDVIYKYTADESPFGCWGTDDDAYYGGGYYAQMLKQAYPAIKQANPNAQVLVGGLLLTCDPRNPPPTSYDGCLPSKFLEGILRGGGGPYFDGVGFHAYDNFLKPSDLNDPVSGLGVYQNPSWSSAWNTTGPVLIVKTEFLRAVLNQYGYGSKYLLATEVALWCGGDSYDPYCISLYPESVQFQNSKAYFTVQVNAAAAYLGLRANIWYNFYGWRDSGLMCGYNGELEAAYNAYSFTRQEINWATAASKLTPYPGVQGYEFVRFDKRVWILWYVGGDPNGGAAKVAFSLPVSPQAVWGWVDVGGGVNAGSYSPLPLNQPDSRVVTVGRAPVFVEFAR